MPNMQVLGFSFAGNVYLAYFKIRNGENFNLQLKHKYIAKSCLTGKRALDAGSLQYSCVPAPQPLPPVPNNLSFFDRNPINHSL